MLIPPTAEQTCRPLAEKHKARGVIVLMFDHERDNPDSDGKMACASYGMTKHECRQMGRLLDRIADQLEDGSLVVWDSLYGDKPLPPAPPRSPAS